MEVKRPFISNVVDDNNNSKRPKIEKKAECNGDGDDHNQLVKFVMPVGFLDPLPPLERQLVNSHNNSNTATMTACRVVGGGDELRKDRKQFWKSGDYEPSHVVCSRASTSSRSVGMDHVRVHPRFLHSNATSHKWALGAFAELLDNALDEVRNGATYVNIDMVVNEKDRSKLLLTEQDSRKMLVVQDNGGGMNPNKMRQCMSLGYSAKSKLANTIGQYGNGFKTSTMRLGADVIVFSVSQGKDGTSATRSIGLLSYTFLTNTGKEDIVVPMVDYEKKGQVWTKMLRSSLDDWHFNLDTIFEWSPFSSEQDLLYQFDTIGNQGTRIVIYNLWEDDKGQLELDFGNDPQDIQLRGVNRDEKKIELTRKYPNCKHFLTYQHSLRSYASILYLRLPLGFRIILRGKDVEHHNLENDMIHPHNAVYRPVPITDGTVRDSNTLPEDMQALVTIGFVKAAEDHMDIQGFSVYHKNRLIKPFWRVWNAAGSDGRGVIGVLEANFVEPAHDKQGFERTMSLQRLEARLVHLQKTYWRDNCHEIGYAPRRSANKISGRTKETTKNISVRNYVKNSDQYSLSVELLSEDEMTNNDLKSAPPRNLSYSHSNHEAVQVNGNPQKSAEIKATDVMKLLKDNIVLKARLEESSKSRENSPSELQLKRERTESLDARVNNLLKELQLERNKIATLEAELNNSKKELQLERERSSSLKEQLEKAKQEIAEMDGEQEALIKIFTEERERREVEEENLRKSSQVASTTIEQLLKRVKELERMKPEK